MISFFFRNLKLKRNEETFQYYQFYVMNTFKVLYMIRKILQKIGKIK